MDNRLFELADQLKTLRDEKKKIEERLKTVNAAIDEVDYKLSEAMTETETQNFTRAGTMFCLTTTTRASATAGRKDDLYTALRGAGHGDLVYSKTKSPTIFSLSLTLNAKRYWYTATSTTKAGKKYPPLCFIPGGMCTSYMIKRWNCLRQSFPLKS